MKIQVTYIRIVRIYIKQISSVKIYNIYIRNTHRFFFKESFRRIFDNIHELYIIYPGADILEIIDIIRILPAYISKIRSRKISRKSDFEKRNLSFNSPIKLCQLCKKSVRFPLRIENHFVRQFQDSISPCELRFTIFPKAVRLSVASSARGASDCFPLAPIPAGLARHALGLGCRASSRFRVEGSNV